MSIFAGPVGFLMAFFGIEITTREQLRAFYTFLHRFVRETITIERFAASEELAAAELARAVREHDVVRLGGLDAVRDFVDVDDVAAAVIAAATCPLPAHGVVNVGSGTAVSARELVGTLVDSVL